MGWLRSLLASGDRTADSIIVGGLFAIMALCGIQAWDVVRNHRELNPFTFGTGAAAILAGIGGGKSLRDRFSPTGDPPTLPEKPSEGLENVRS